jgi:APA family basic amino acid/polyamine antiporter
MLFASSRISYGMARSGTLPRLFSRVHVTRRTPWVAIIAVSFGAFLFLFAGDIGFVANVSNFTLFVTFLVVNAAVIILRFHDPGRIRPFRVPGRIGVLPVLPLFGIVSCLVLFIQLTPVVVGVGAVLTIIGGIAALFAGRRIRPEDQGGPGSGQEPG